MTSLTTIRRASGIALLIGWAATLLISIGTLRADTGRAQAKGIAVEIPIAGLSLAATVVYAVSRLGRGNAHDLMDTLIDLQDHAANTASGIQQARTNNVGGNVHRIDTRRHG